MQSLCYFINNNININERETHIFTQTNYKKYKKYKKYNNDGKIYHPSKTTHSQTGSRFFYQILTDTNKGWCEHLVRTLCPDYISRYTTNTTFNHDF
mgnify:CR=1 FL=1